MNTTSTLSIATLVLAGLFTTGCSQQQVDGDNSGGSQVAGSSQQVAGPSQTSSQQVAGSSQTSQQQAAPAEETAAPEPAAEPKADPNSHTHPAVPNCTNSVTHTHPNGNRPHTHRYSCKGMTKHHGGGNRWTHRHPAIPHCTDSITHTHKYKNRNHHHKYSCKGAARRSGVNVHALQRKLKAKGYYRGPINGVVTPETRSALQRYMQNR